MLSYRADSQGRAELKIEVFVEGEYHLGWLGAGEEGDERCGGVWFYFIPAVSTIPYDTEDHGRQEQRLINWRAPCKDVMQKISVDCDNTKKMASKNLVEC
nr:hypothetical protein BgiMline_024422 [Biomphalaria glabrata]